MRRKVSSIIFLLLSVCILLYLNSCSCLFTLGNLASEDKEPQRTFIVQSLKTENIESGTQVIINLKDGTTVKGNYLGTDTIPNEKYDKEYAELQKQIPELPSKGDTVTVISEFVDQNPVKFLRFGYGNILLGGIDYDYGVRLKLRDLGKIIDKHGRELEGEEIQKLISEGKFPPLLLPEIIVEEYIPNEDGWPKFNTRKRFININDLEDVQKGSSKSGIIQSLKTENIKLGTQAIINLKDGTIVRGKYAGIDSIYDEKYDKEYAELQKKMPEGSSLPSKGDTITVISKIVHRNPVKFQGFNYDNILLSRIGHNEIVKLKLEKLEKIIDKHGRETKSEEIINLTEMSTFPFFFSPGISIEEYTGEEDKYWHEITRKKFVDLNDIDNIQIESTKNSIGNSCFNGCVIDATIIALIFFL